MLSGYFWPYAQLLASLSSHLSPFPPHTLLTTNQKKKELHGTHPLRQKQPRTNRITPNLRPLTRRKHPHQLQLRGLGHTIRQTTPRRRNPRNRRRHDERPALRVSSERRQRRAQEVVLRLDVDGEAGVPVGGGGGVEVGDGGEACPAL